MYIITGASGNVGKAVAIKLLSEGKQIRAIARHADNLDDLSNAGAEIMAGDIYNNEFVRKAFEGGNAAFLMIPPNFRATDFRKDQEKVTANYIDAVKEHNLTHVVLLSSIGAHLRNGAGVIDGLGAMEESFKQLRNVNVLNLRATYFMENTFSQISLIKSMGIMGSSVDGDLVFPMVASKDVAAVVAKRLSELSFHGNTVEYVLGPEDVSFKDIAKIYGKAIGKPDLQYITFSYEDAEKAMTGSGVLSQNVARLYNGMSEGMNNGSIFNDHNRTAENSTPTTISEFSKHFAEIYKASS